MSNDSSIDHATCSNSAPYAKFQEEGVKDGRRGKVSVGAGFAQAPRAPFPFPNRSVHRGFPGVHFMREALQIASRKYGSYFG